MALTLCGCAASDLKPTPGTPKLAVDLSALDVCAKVLAPVGLPAVKPQDDARVAFMKDDAALIRARNEIFTGRNCIGDVKKAYAGQK